MLHYLDNAATTPVCPQAAQAALEAMTQGWGNPSSQYALGAQAAARMGRWRAGVARALGCAPEELFFTSCGSESDNWAVQGAAELNRRAGNHIVTTAIEHAAVLEPVKALERQGFEVTWLQPDRTGHIAAQAVKDAVRPDTVLVSMMLVNNELGTLLPVRAAADAIAERGSPALLHCDAVQGFLKVPFTPKDLGADLVTVSGHKVHAPKGVGALYVRKGLKLPPLIRGGGQEGGLRSGTEATSQIAAFAAAVESWQPEMTASIRRIRDYAAERLSAIDGVELIGQGDAPHILPISLSGYKSEVVVRFLSDRDIFLSSGSACHRGRPSHVFAALKLPKPLLDGALRVSFSHNTTQEDIDALADGLLQARRELFPAMS